MAILVSAGLWGCGDKVASTNTTIPAEEFSGWDTSLSYHGFNPLTSEAMARAVVSAGTDGRLPAFLKKCRAGGEIRIGFIGGSVTAGASATAQSQRYSSLLCNFMGRLFPKARFREFNVGVGGTDSRFGVSRLQEDLLIYAPDLVLVEYAVNDDPNDSVLFPPSLEGLVRQCLAAGNTAVMLYFTTNSAGSTAGEDVKIPTGLHYGLPMVSLLRAVWPYVQDGRIPVDSLIVDGVHPRDLGHFIGAYSLFSFIRTLAVKDSGSAIASVPAPLYGTVYDTAGIFHSGDANLKITDQGNWTLKAKEGDRLGLVGPAAGPGLEIRFAGKELTLGYHVSKSGNGRLEVSVNGNPVDTLTDSFPADWGGGVMRLKQLHLSREPQNTVVRLTLLEGFNFNVDYLLYAGPRAVP